MSRHLDAHLTYLRAAGFAVTSIYCRETILAHADRDLPRGLDEATTDELAAWLANPRWSAWTRKTYYSHLTGLYRWALESGRIDRDPSAGLKRPRNPDDDPNPATDEQLRLALERSGPMWQRAIVLAAYGGLRAGEAARLRREDVTAERVRIVEGKGGKSKFVPQHPEIWRRVEPMPPGLLLPTRTGRPHHKLSTRAREHFDAIGLPEVHLHMFRAWYACTLLTTGADIRTVQSLMRHASLATTAAYLNVVEARRQTAVAALPTIGG